MFTPVPFPFEHSSSQKGPGREQITFGYGVNTWVDPATYLVSPRPRWREIGPRYYNNTDRRDPKNVIPFQPVYAADRTGGARLPEIVTHHWDLTTAQAVLQGLRWSNYPGTPVMIHGLANAATSADGANGDHHRVVYSPDGNKAWAIIRAYSGPDAVVEYVNGGASTPPSVTVIPGLASDTRCISLAFAGGRLFLLCIESGTPRIRASAVGVGTFASGYTMDLSYNPDSSSQFRGGSGIMTMDGRRLLVFSEGVSLVYDIQAASLTLANAVPGLGTIAEGGCCQVGDQGLMIGPFGLVWVTQEVFRTNYKPQAIDGGASSVAQEWYAKLMVNPSFGNSAGTNAGAEASLVSNYVKEWNCVFFSSPLLNETLYVYLGDPQQGREPYASVWNTSWSKAWSVYRAPVLSSPTPDVVANYIPMAMVQRVPGTFTWRFCMLETSELYDFQQNQIGVYGDSEADFSAYVVSAPLPLKQDNTPQTGASVRGTSLDVILANRDEVSTAPFWLYRPNDTLKAALDAAPAQATQAVIVKGELDAYISAPIVVQIFSGTTMLLSVTQGPCVIGAEVDGTVNVSAGPTVSSSFYLAGTPTRIIVLGNGGAPILDLPAGVNTSYGVSFESTISSYDVGMTINWKILMNRAKP